MKKHYYLGITILSVIFITGISLVFAQSWKAPAQPPPSGNASAPINTSDVSQTKEGNLWAEDLFTFGAVYADQDIFAVDTPESTTNLEILTISPFESFRPGEFKRREAGPWASPFPLSGYERVMGPEAPSDIGSTATCSEDKKVIGGGCDFESIDGNKRYWGWGYPNTEGSFFCISQEEISTIRAYAICASGL
jgi:hypothetical protein